ncbi:hypothetical protein CEXT_394651 [Caerostris extrusa]|uniref:Uncharacterized protein n=1 Tax=Caerostris extrusa TaxID=172846 RepID=A0AAV4VJR2_CAEEX|nr:hypothetical protein CEXT_394651 [Caerostris extrusa]
MRGMRAFPDPGLIDDRALCRALGLKRTSPHLESRGAPCKQGLMNFVKVCVRGGGGWGSFVSDESFSTKRNKEKKRQKSNNTKSIYYANKKSYCTGRKTRSARRKWSVLLSIFDLPSETGSSTAAGWKTNQ